MVKRFAPCMFSRHVGLSNILDRETGQIAVFVIFKVAVLLQAKFCRFVKHIGQSKMKESEEENAIEEDAWDESCCDFGGQLAAHQSR